MFINEDDVIDVKIFYKKSSHYKNRYEAYTDGEFSSLDLEEDVKESYDILNLQMRELTWGLYNDLQEIAMVDTNSGERRFNYKIYRESRLLKLIKHWSAKDTNDKPIPVNNVSITHLSPSIAEAILRAYDSVSLVSEEEEKNL